MRHVLLVSYIALDRILNFDHDPYALHVFVYHSISCGFGRKVVGIFHKELIDKIYDLIASVLVFVRAENHLLSLDLRRSWLHII